MQQHIKMAEGASNVGSYFTILVAVLATITEIATLAAIVMASLAVMDIRV